MIKQQSPQTLSQLIAELQQILDEQGDLIVNQYSYSESRYSDSLVPAGLGVVTDERGVQKLDVAMWYSIPPSQNDTIDIGISLILEDIDRFSFTT